MAIERARKKLQEALTAARKGDGQEAFEDLSAARFHLFDEECYTETLVNAFDDALDVAWRLWRDKLGKEEAARRLSKIIDRIERLIEKPQGEKARKPTRVKTERDARLWDFAKWLVSDEYPDVKEDSERYWKLVSGIFTRLKLRLGGLPAKKVDKIVEILQEKYGKLPPVGKGSKKEKEIERLKEEVKRLLLKSVLPIVRHFLRLPARLAKFWQDDQGTYWLDWLDLEEFFHFSAFPWGANWEEIFPAIYQTAPPSGGEIRASTLVEYITNGIMEILQGEDEEKKNIVKKYIAKMVDKFNLEPMNIKGAWQKKKFLLTIYTNKGQLEQKIKNLISLIVNYWLESKKREAEAEKVWAEWEEKLRRGEDVRSTR